MDDWRTGLQNYQNGINSIAQSNLRSAESIAQSKASLISGQEASLASATSANFGDMIKEQSNKFMAEMNLDFGASGALPTLFKGAKYLASWRSNALNRQWKVAQSTRFNEQAQAEDVDGNVGGVGGKPGSALKDAGFTEEDAEGMFDGPRATVSETSFSTPEPRQVGSGYEEQPAKFKATMETDPDMEANTISKEVGSATEDASAEAGKISSQVDSVAEGAEAEAGDVVADLAPEITEASSAWAGVAGAIGDAIPFIGGALAIYGTVSAGESIKSTIDDENANPYASIAPELKSAQNKISGLEASVSADEFASKIGARMPQYGSLAARPNLDTAMSVGMALHV